MSRIGNAIIEIPKEVTVKREGNIMVFTGPKGEARFTVPTHVEVVQEGTTFIVKRKHNDKKTKSLHGFTRAIIANQIHGITKGWTKVLELSGVGYRANLAGANLVLSVGFSHQVTIVPEPGIAFAVAENKITVSGIDKYMVGQVAAKVREVRKPEPYKGKGIKYAGEHIRKKAGKAKAVGAPGGAK